MFDGVGDGGNGGSCHGNGDGCDIGSNCCNHGGMYTLCGMIVQVQQNSQHGLQCLVCGNGGGCSTNRADIMYLVQGL